MEVLVGIKGKDFVLLMTDMTAANSILTLKHDEDKIVALDKRQLLGCSGDQSSRVQFTEYIEKNLALQKLRTGRSLSNHATANFVRNEIASALRSRGGAYQVNSLLGTFDEREGPALYYLDYLGTMQKIDYGAHGYPASFGMSQLDSGYYPNITVDEAIELCKVFCDQLARRYLLNFPKYMFKIINEKGVQEIEHLRQFSEY